MLKNMKKRYEEKIWRKYEENMRKNILYLYFLEVNRLLELIHREKRRSLLHRWLVLLSTNHSKLLKNMKKNILYLYFLEVIWLLEFIHGEKRRSLLHRWLVELVFFCCTVAGGDLVPQYHLFLPVEVYCTHRYKNTRAYRVPNVG